MAAAGWVVLMIIILVTICVIACCVVFACMIFDLGPWEKKRRPKKEKEVIVVNQGMDPNMQMMQMQQM